MKTVICAVGKDQTIGFAARELARCLRKATGRAVPIVPESRVRPGDAVLRLALLSPALSGPGTQQETVVPPWAPGASVRVPPTLRAR